jgi:hypothetical protein
MTTSAQTQPTVPVLRGGGLSAGVSFVVGLAAFALLCWGFFHDPQRAFHSYLTAYAFALSAALGSIAFVLIAHAANTTWPVAVRRLPEAVAPAMPLLAVLFFPLVFGIQPLYPWARLHEFEPRVQELLIHRQAFMNPGFFVLRAGLYLLLWSWVALALRRYSLAMEQAADPARLAARLRRLSYAALPLMALTTAFSGFEWLMSLSAEFSSTMFGALWIAVCLFGGMACTVVLTGIAQRSGSPLPAPGPAHYSALGRLLFAFLFFLAYVVFFQFMLAWIGNRPSEAQWFSERSRGVYFGTCLFLIFGHFAVPFLLLLSYRLKRRIEALTWVGYWCLLSQYVHIHWLITPASHEPGYSWWDLVALVAVLATTVSFCMWRQRGKSLVPSFDPRYAESFSYQSR